MTQKVLVIGSGGREHALARAFSKSKHVSEVFVAPGNPGMVLGQHDNDAPITCIAIDPMNSDALIALVKAESISVTFVGPEQPLSDGIVDVFNREQLPIVGPTQYSAQLESSKSFAKSIMQKADVPTAKYAKFEPEDLNDALKYVKTQSLPIVIKQDGLAAGKGVVIAQTYEEAESTVIEMLETHRHHIIIEEFMTGEEFSVFSLVNHRHVIHVGVARDYKRAYDFDQGLNTGGMGAYASVPWVNETVLNTVYHTIIQPLANQMADDQTPYTGVLYTGLMMTSDGPKVVEFNCRFGDPETQIVLPLIETDFYELIQAHLSQSPITVTYSQDVALGVVLAAQGYPGEYVKDIPINLDASLDLGQICFAGVTQGETSTLKSSGGRILMVTCQGETFDLCRQRVYEQLQLLTSDATFYRQDIGETIPISLTALRKKGIK